MIEEKNHLSIRWQVHLIRREPQKAAVIAACMVFAALFGIWAFHHWLPGFIGAWLIFSSTVEFLWPISYELSDKGAQSRCLWQLNRINWENVRNVYADQTGVKLSPFEQKSRLEAFRGVYLRFEGNQEQVMSAIEEWRRQHAPVERTAERRAEANTH